MAVASLRRVFSDWSPDELHALFGGTAAQVYDLDLEALSALDFGPTVAEVSQPLAELPDNPSMAFKSRPGA